MLESLHVSMDRPRISKVIEMSASNVDNFRSILSDNFGKILNCLAPMAFASVTRSEREDDYLESLRKAALSSRAKSRTQAKNLVGRSGYCSFEIDGAKTHKKIWVDFLGASRPCEIGDIMIVSKFVDSLGVLSRHTSLLQAKVDEKQKRQTWHIDRTQLRLYKSWPLIKCCYTRSGSRKYPLLQNFKVNHSDRLFSPYLLVMREWAPSFVTSVDLISSACRKSNTIHGPLELSFLSLLVQLLFQTAGEQDISTHNSTNSNLTTLVDKILQHVNLNDPIEGEGRPFIVLKLTVKGEFERN